MGEFTEITLININKQPYFNYSFCVNNYSFLESVVWQLEGKSLENIRIEITSQLGLFDAFEEHHDTMPVGNHSLQNIKFNYDLSFLKQLVERDIDVISFKIFSNNELVFQTTFNLPVLPVDYFGGLNVYPELLASYVLANHPLIYQIKSDAVTILEKNKLTASFEGYQSQNKERVLQMVSALYQAMVNLQLVYSAMPASFETEGQRIRLIDQVLETKFGNCIDISLLFAACLEAVDLNPILVITHGHAFVGVWLDDQRFNDTVTYDATALTKRIALGIKEIALVEATSLCKGNQLKFKDAMVSAEAQMLQINNFSMAIDIKNARSKGIRLLPVYVAEEVSNDDIKSNITSHKIDKKFEIGAIYDDLDLGESQNLTKQKIWERKLLDLSLRNNLLNIRFTKSMLQLVDLNINLLEDHLANGKSFTLQPNNSQPIAGKYNLYTEPLHESDPLYQFADSEFKYNRLYTHYHQIELDAVLTHLFRNAKLAEEENGKSTLYLGVGLLKWIEPKNKDIPRLAPLLLIPVELSRKSVNAAFTLRSREEETMINITLLEYLRQEFQLDLSGLENLPMDDAGVDVKKVLTLFRKEILNLKGWDVLEQTFLGTFSFNKLILWQDISKFSEEIQKSAIVKSLIDGKLHESLNTDTLNIDLETLPANWLTLPIATDHSQLEAVLNANANKSFVLHGPPGTGKSQTITNIIADALANNKKVLFVAAKKAALDVVHTRLDKIGLGAFCLELHSNKSKKSDVLVQLAQSLAVPKDTNQINFNEEANRIDQRKTELSQYINLLHKPLTIGWTLYDTISYLDINEVEVNQELILKENLLLIDASTWNNWKDWSFQMEGLTSKMSDHPSKHPLRFISLQEQNFSHKNNIQEAISEFEKSTQEVDKLNSDYNFPFKEPYNQQVAGIIELLDNLQNFNADQSVVDVFFNTSQLNVLNNWLELQTQFQTKEDQIIVNFNPNILTANTSEFEQIWNQSKHTWFLPKWLKQRKVKQFLNGFSKQKISDAFQIDNIFSDLSVYNSLKRNLNEPQYQSIYNTTNQYLKNQRFDVYLLQQHIKQLGHLKQTAESLNLTNFQSWWKHYFDNSFLKSGINDAVQQLKSYQKAHKNIQFYLNENADSSIVSTVKNNLHLLEDWITYNHYKQKAVDLNLKWFIDLLEQNKIKKDRLAKQFEDLIHLNLFVQTLNSSAVLNTFDANVYEALIDQYKKTYQEFTEITKNQLQFQLSNNIPNLTQEAISSSEIGILQKAIRNKARGVSIRKLFDQIPTLLPRLKPCMLMSPISVAQYFDVDTNHFDLVIFDEASQLPTSEAISALARAKQAIIVGDPKQMPPTSFFASTKIDEENMELEDLESILDDTLAISIPSKYLLRHYRSKHESLIAFSNANFYENKLLTFPSADDLDKKVTFEYIAGHYDKGNSRTNKQEAEAIVLYIKNHLQSGKKESVGVVTFSQTQQVLIEDLLQKLYQENPFLEEKALLAEEPIFIKNLENVQGDERDIILFSIGYGADENGKLSMNFGPLNREGGWRRLNVAVTRARYEMKVFSSLKADQIDLNRTQAEGVKGLKGFLNFAEKGLLPSNFNTANNIQKQNLIESISRYLNENGLEVKTNIGTSAYRLDIGIVDPENKDQYVLGILVDGENYVQTQTTNDRELLIPSVLEGLGWNIYRIWTLDWIKNKDKIVAEIKQKIKSEK